ncbi:MAG: Aminotransferase, classes I and II, partial [Candidatus Falkowbacteria bacterium GW2011_GWF2_39_8]
PPPTEASGETHDVFISHASEDKDDFVLQREIIHEWLKENDIAFEPSTGGIFIFPDFTKIMQKKNLATSIDLASYFLDKVDVATTPGSAFGENYDTHLRISYCIDPEELKIALEKLSEAIKLDLNPL